MSQLIIAESAAPSTPSSGKVTLYAKTDGLLYSKDDAGNESALSVPVLSVAKGWAYVDITAGTPTISSSYNVSSVTDGGAGITTVNWNTDFATGSYACVVTPESSNEVDLNSHLSNKVAGSIIVRTVVAGTYTDNINFNILAFGTQ